MSLMLFIHFKYTTCCFWMKTVFFPMNTFSVLDGLNLLIVNKLINCAHKSMNFAIISILCIFVYGDIVNFHNYDELINFQLNDFLYTLD
jgi:hypothetical protein